MDEVFEDPTIRKWINSHYLREEIIHGLRDVFTSAGPFPYLQIPEFFNYEPLDLLVEELSQQEFYPQSSDLFQLAQTADFEFIETPYLSEFRTLFRSSPFLKLMTEITTVALSADIDMMGNIYQDTDYLLCHDDKLSRRKIAYILYLTDLDEGDGGTLNLFNTRDGKPNQIVEQLVPKMNAFTFFLVTPISFHEVEEIINPNIYRVSISGWFNND
jgi:Rps23 Pro-64 3,4-dihydroxylase Tpa1-like proline 4-hydroxylase